MDGYSLADIRAVTQDEHEGFGFGGGLGWLIIILLFFMAFGGGWGNGFGNNNVNGISDLERDVLKGNCDTQRDVLNSQYNTLLGFKDQQLQISECCCANKLMLSEQTNALQQAIHCEGEQTRALINANTIQELRDRLETANNALTTQTIVNQVVEQIRPCAKPAYLTCSPYVSYYPYGYYGFNNGCSGCNGNF